MSEISSGEVSSSSVSGGDVSSSEVSGDSSATQGSDVSTSEVSEVESASDVSESDVDEDFSAELDDSYSSYMEDGKIEDFEKENLNEVTDINETSESETTDDSLDHELDGKYSDYLNGEHTSDEVGEQQDVPEIQDEAKDDSENIDAELDKKYNEYIGEANKDAENVETPHGELSEEDRAKLKEETGWSNEVVESIDTAEQADIYKNADLHEENINGRECLVKEIDYDYVDEKTGMTKRELMAKGRSPYDAKTGEKIELHHMGQEYDAPFAELTENSEHGDGNHSTLHPKTEGSWRNDEALEAQYRKEKREHWKTRSEV